jgi:anti-sigma regulatory factor (Ser/Thr protein kinase)
VNSEGASPLEELRIEVPALPQNVALIRRKVEAHAQALGLAQRRIDDLKTVVSEACGNVVRYAYDDKEARRPLEVTLAVEEEALRITVQDQGKGIRQAGPPGSNTGLGLSLIAALSNGFSLHSRPGGGTQLRISFSLAS